MYKKESPRGLLNAELAAVEWSQKNTQNVLCATGNGGQPIMKKKISLIMAMMLAIAILTTGALAAAGLIFSPRYDALQLSNQALLDKYGITEEMQPGLIHTITEENGATVITYNAAEHTIMKDNRFGTYTVTVRDGKAEATWSMDGIATSGGLDASAWGADQLLLYARSNSTVMAYMNAHDMLMSMPFDEVQIKQQAAKWEENKKTALAMAQITLEDAASLAKDVLATQYGLTEQQINALIHYTGEEDESTYEMVDDHPLVNMPFHLMQTPGEWQEKDGVYVVTINLLDGAVEDIYYDNMLMGNG